MDCCLGISYKGAAAKTVQREDATAGVMSVHARCSLHKHHLQPTDGLNLVLTAWVVHS